MNKKAILIMSNRQKAINKNLNARRKNGEMFANALLKKLSICAPTGLEKVVQEIYGETDLIVTRV